MKTTRATRELRAAVGDWRRHRLTIGLVPTMGALHAGHLALVRRAGELADRVVASVFVNPTQFDDAADLAAYPRQPERDAGMLAEAGCHLLFLPRVEEIYPAGHATHVEVAGPARGLEGERRPGHFRGVATVVTQLLNLVHPDLAVFGEKDAQQLAVVRRLVRDLHLLVQVVAHPTVREADGLALSSRNARLDPRRRAAAAVLYRALSAGAELVRAGERSADTVRRRMREILASEPHVEVEYAEVVDGDSFHPVATIDAPVVLPVAARLGDVRLIDNLAVAPAGVPAARPRTETETVRAPSPPVP